MLAKNIIRINGYKNGKRSHVDVEVKMEEVRFVSNGKEVTILAPQHIYDVAEKGFELGLDAVTSFNMWNWVGKKRYTEKVL